MEVIKRIITPTGAGKGVVNLPIFGSHESPILLVMSKVLATPRDEAL